MKFFFIANRAFVFEEMQQLECEFSKIFAVKNSYFERYLNEKKIDYSLLNAKSDLLAAIEKTDFDVFLANGCPYILPISQLQKGNKKKFVNIHPSFLPDLRGADPHPGAILYKKDSGATCHLMDDGIDSGAIIAREKIPFSDGLDVALLYQLTFQAEKKVFQKAYGLNFHGQIPQKPKNTDVYYTFDPVDLAIDLKAVPSEIRQKIKAFNNKSKGAYLYYQNKKVKIADCEVLKNDYINQMYEQKDIHTVVLEYENKLLLKKEDCFLKLTIM